VLVPPHTPRTHKLPGQAYKRRGFVPTVSKKREPGFLRDLPKREKQVYAAERRNSGDPIRAIALDLGVTERTVYNYLDAIGWHEKKSENSAPESLERTLEAFRLFYTRFSGLPFPPHWESWVRDYFEHPRLLLNTAPRHAKSKLFSVWLPLFEICLDPDIQIIVITNAGDMAGKWANEMAYHFEYNASLISAFGPFRPERGTSMPWRPLQGEFMVARRQRPVLMGDLSYQVKGRREQVLGAEADLVILDDITDLEISRSPAERQKLSDKVHGDIMTRLTPRGRVAVVGQRVHPLDIYNELALKKIAHIKGSPPLWHHLNYPAITDWEKQEVLWPEVWSFDRLMETLEDMRRGEDTSLFQAMYQQNPQYDTISIIQDREWIDGSSRFRGCWDVERAFGQAPSLEGFNSEHQVRTRILSVDPSPTKYTGIVLADVDKPRIKTQENENDWECHVIHLEHGKYGLREIVGRVKYFVEDPLLRPDYLIFEVNAAQRWFYQDAEFMALNRMWRLPLIQHTTKAHTHTDDEFGPQSLSGDFEWGQIRLPGKTPQDRMRCEPLIDEGINWGALDHGDIMMGLWFIKFNYRVLAPRSRKTSLRIGGGQFNPGPQSWEFLR
jgi:hypothetical protein